MLSQKEGAAERRANDGGGAMRYVSCQSLSVLIHAPRARVALRGLNWTEVVAKDFNI